MLRYTILDIIINDNDNISQETIADFNLTNNIKS